MEVIRKAQKIEVSFHKTIHIRDFEMEEYTGSLTVTFDRALTPEESTVEINKLQAELEYAMYYSMYMRKQVTTHELNRRVELLTAQLTQLGVPNAADYLKGGVQVG